MPGFRELKPQPVQDNPSHLVLGKQLEALYGFVVAAIERVQLDAPRVQIAFALDNLQKIVASAVSHDVQFPARR
jgi:hypothetical protein